MNFVLFSEQVINYLWTVSWQCFVLAVIVFGITRLFPSLSPRWKQAFWALVFLRAILPAGVVLPTSVRQILDALIAGFQASPSTSPDILPISSPMIESSAINVTITPASSSIFDMITPSTVLVSLWFIGMLVMITIQIRGVVRLRNQIRLSSNSADELSKRVVKLCTELKLSQKVNIRLSDHKISPYLTGLFHPVIVIPKEVAENSDQEQLDAILLHELTHLRYKDNWLAFIQNIIMIPFFFHPALWLAARTIGEERELACDEAVLNSGRISRDTYASTLLTLMKDGFRSPALSLSMAAYRSKAADRLHRIMNHDKRSPKFVLPLVLMLICSSMFLTLEAQKPNIDQDSNESVVLLESSQADNTSELEVATYQILPTNQSLPMDEEREFQQTVIYMIETLLYSKDGIRAAETVGRKLLLSDDSKTITVIDYAQNQAAVKEFLNGIGSVALETGLQTRTQHLDHRMSSRIVGELNEVISEAFEPGEITVIPLGNTDQILILYKDSKDLQTVLDYIDILDVPQMTTSIKMVFLELTNDSSDDTEVIKKSMEDEVVTFQMLEEWEAEGYVKLIEAPSVTVLMNESAQFNVTTESEEIGKNNQKTTNIIKATTTPLITASGNLKLKLEVETEMTKSSGARTNSNEEIVKTVPLNNNKSPLVIQKYGNPKETTSGYVIGQWTLVTN